MNPPKWDDLDYIHFLIAAQKVFTCTEAARCAPEEERAPAHDAFTRLLPTRRRWGRRRRPSWTWGRGFWSWMIRRWTSRMPRRWIG
jgi:hypothetical protein